MELASFYSASKGYVGECGEFKRLFLLHESHDNTAGLRGGYVEFVNLDPKVYVEFKKMISAKLCSTVLGQAVMDCIVKPPREGEPSYEQWARERRGVLDSLAERANAVTEAFNAIEGVKCNPVQGAM